MRMALFSITVQLPPHVRTGVRSRPPACAGAARQGYPPDPVFGGLHAPMLARLERTLPRGGRWRYEPKLGGFRGLLWSAPSGSIHLLSRNLKDLSHDAFPEVWPPGANCRWTHSSMVRS
jgi:hypothetical protein